MEKLKDTAPETAPDSERGDQPKSRWSRKVIIISGFILVAMFVAGGYLGPDNRVTQAAIDQGVAAHNRGDLATAQRFYIQALERDRDNKFTHYNLGLIAQQTGRLEESEARYNEALALDPYFLPAIYNLAVLKENSGQNESAVALYRRAIEAHPNRAAPHFRLGIVLGTKLGRVEEGRAEIVKAAELNPRIAEALRGAADRKSVV
jgi:tetratricopeptide (TPR) repeat protein